MRMFLMVLLTSFVLSSCNFGFAKNEEVVGKYHIVAIDVAGDAALSYETEDGNYVGLIPTQVFEYGHNAKYIYLKQSEYGSEDTSAVNYYIVPVVADTVTVYPQERIIGPLKEEAFNKEISVLGIKSVEFKQVD